MPDSLLQGTLNLVANEGYVMGLIFLLSLYLYTLALRAYTLSWRAASPFKSIVNNQLVPKKLNETGSFWISFHASIDQLSGSQEAQFLLISTAKRKLRRTIDSQLSLLKMLVATAPLLGLLGTITGMVETFSALSSNNSGETASMVADGISKALLTTTAGLVVAIPATILLLVTNRKAEQAYTVFSALRNGIGDEATRAA